MLSKTGGGGGEVNLSQWCVGLGETGIDMYQIMDVQGKRTKSRDCGIMHVR